MNINSIIKHLEEATPEQLEQKDHRRNWLRGVGLKLAAASLPFAAGSLYTNKAYGQSKETIINVLNYLLKLEYIVEEFYKQAMAADIVPSAFKSQFEQIVANNASHVTIIKDLIKELGGTAYTLAAADMDLSGGEGLATGPFYNSRSDFPDMLIFAQMMADGGARMYKGAITEVLSDNETVTALTNIHSAKVRQAAFIRFMRNYWVGDDVKPWITASNSDTVNTGVQRAYAGESVTTQAGIFLPGINGFDVSVDAASQAFDEPLIIMDGNAILDRFIKINP